MSDVEMQLPLQNQDPDIPVLEWSSMTVVLEGDNKLELQKIIQDHGAKSAMFLSGGTKQETSIFRAAKTGAVECLQILLGIRPSPDIVDQPDKDGLSPLLIATMKAQHQIMKILIKAECNINARNDMGDHALHILANDLIIGKSQSIVFECLDLLVNTPGIDIDPTNNLIHTPLLTVAEYINKNEDDSQNNSNLITFCRRLYEKGASLDSKDSYGKTVKNILEEKGVLTAIQVKDPPKKVIRPWISQLYDVLISGNDNEKLAEILDSHHEDKIRKIINSWLGSVTILVYVVNRMNTKAMKLLLDAGADPWKYNGSGELPIHFALARGHTDSLNILLKAMHGVSNPAQPLDFRNISFSLFEKLFENERKTDKLEEGVNRSKCLQRLFNNDVLINSNHAKLSKKTNKTVLHLSAHFNNQEAIRLLIENGAYLGARQRIINSDEGTVIDAIHAQTLETAMDKCISQYTSPDQNSEEQIENILHPNYTLDLDYKFLLPPNANKESVKRCTNEVETLMDLKNSDYHTRIIKHPLIQTFLYAKWRKVLPLYIANLLIYLSFVILLTYFMYCLTDLRVLESRLPDLNVTNSEFEKIISYRQNVWTFRFLIFLPFCYMVFREMFQIIFTYKTYLYNIENYLEWFLLIVVMLLTTVTLSPDVTRHLSAWAMIIAW